jgi:hypothetical protein
MYLIYRHEPRYLMLLWISHTVLQRPLYIALVAQMPVAGSLDVGTHRPYTADMYSEHVLMLSSAIQ